MIVILLTGIAGPAFQEPGIEPLSCECVSVGGRKKDASVSASGYLGFGNAPFEAYEAAEALVEQYLARKYRGSVPGFFNTMKCIDLYYSQQLAALALKSTAENSQ